MRNWICHDAGPGRYFAVFNDCGLTNEPVTDADIVPIMIDSRSKESSAAWSANCDWYFIVTEHGIVLARSGQGAGVCCLKKSWHFIAAFVDEPLQPRKSRKKTGEL